MLRTASLSRDGRYRYTLSRVWDATAPLVLFVGLNPSTADHRQDDPTIRRCVRFASDWGFGGLLVANLFALRSSSPRALDHAVDPVGRYNDRWLRRLSSQAALTVAAWGGYGTRLGRDRIVQRLLREPCCLGLTMNGHPRHPLYVRATMKPIPLLIAAQRH